MDGNTPSLTPRSTPSTTLNSNLQYLAPALKRARKLGPQAELELDVFLSVSSLSCWQCRAHNAYNLRVVELCRARESALCPSALEQREADDTRGADRLSGPEDLSGMSLSVLSTPAC